MRNLILTFFLVLIVTVATASSDDGAPKLTLKESINIALDRSLIVDSAQEDIAVSELQEKGVRTSFYPKLSTAYNYMRFHDSPTSKVLGTQTGTQNNYSWSMEATQPVYTGGKISGNYRMSKLGVEISRMSEKRVKQDIVLEVKEAYFGILKAERILTVARQAEEQLKAHRDMARSFFEVGIIPKNDLLYSEVELANGQKNVVKAENGVALAKAKFNTILRRNIDDQLDVEDTLNYIPFRKEAGECIEAALKNRYIIKEYDLIVRQAGEAIVVAKSDFYPSVSVVGNYSKYGDDPDLKGSKYKDQEEWYLMAVANWNIWEWGRTKYNVSAEVSRERQARNTLENIRDQIALEVKNSFLLLREAEKHIMVAKVAIHQAEENYRINEERFREQVATSTDVIDAQTLLTRTKSDYYNALSEYNIAMARLERAMGVVIYEKRIKE
ncbi:MAG: TolC family protein [Deltaproteobacteria bacterium]|nr:TolC family protein [Deltaproteobacteria bacterium]